MLSNNKIVLISFLFGQEVHLVYLHLTNQWQDVSGLGSYEQLGNHGNKSFPWYQLCLCHSSRSPFSWLCSTAVFFVVVVVERSEVTDKRLKHDVPILTFVLNKQHHLHCRSSTQSNKQNIQPEARAKVQLFTGCAVSEKKILNESTSSPNK